MTEVNSWADFIKSIGFPIFVSVFVLIRMERALTEISKALTGLTVVIQSHFGPMK